MILLQLAFTASVLVNGPMQDQDHFYRDREAFGVRLLSPQLIEMGYQAPLRIQAGIMAANENGLFPSKSGGGVRHWAIGLDQQLNPEIRVGLIYGRFVAQRSDERPRADSVAEIDYYQLVALGATVTDSTGRYQLTLEKLLATPKAVHAGLHQFIARFRSPQVDIMLQLIEHSDPPHHQFLTYEAVVRPLWQERAPFKWLGLAMGRRAVPSYDRPGDVPLGYWGVGIFMGGTVP